jgi:hypothetical protein
VWLCSFVRSLARLRLLLRLPIPTLPLLLLLLLLLQQQLRSPIPALPLVLLLLRLQCSCLARLLLLLLRPQPALLLRTAALQQLLHVSGSIYPTIPHPDGGMKHLPSKHPQRPWQALVSGPTVRFSPRRVGVCSGLQAPGQGVLRVIHGWGGDML